MVTAFAVDTKCKSRHCTGEIPDDSLECCQQLSELGFQDGLEKCLGFFTEAECSGNLLETFGCPEKTTVCTKDGATIISEWTCPKQPDPPPASAMSPKAVFPLLILLPILYGVVF